jgi:hypothetical protein
MKQSRRAHEEPNKQNAAQTAEKKVRQGYVNNRHSKASFCAAGALRRPRFSFSALRPMQGAWDFR